MRMKDSYQDNGFQWPPEAWAGVRGLGNLDYNGFILLVRSSVEVVAGAIAKEDVRWEPDVLGKEIVRRKDALFVYRFCGHPWSIVVGAPFGDTPLGRKGHEWEKSLSRRLGVPIIAYGRSDTCCSIGYTLIEEGEVVEDFFAEDDDNRPDPRTSFFKSTRRDVRLDRIGDIYDFVEDFFVEYDAFDPAFSFDYFFNHAPSPYSLNRVPPSEVRATVVNPGIVTVYPQGPRTNVPVIERVDHLALSGDDRRGCLTGP